LGAIFKITIKQIKQQKINTMSTNSNDEIDLGLIFRKIQEIYHSMLVVAYHGVRFAAKHWIILAVLIIGGSVLGHFWQKNQKVDRATTLIVQNNFGSSSYVYNAIQQLNGKMNSKDDFFLNKIGFNSTKPEISKLEIEPIVNIMELLDKNETSDRNLEQYLSQSDFQEDLLLSEVFFTEYRYHKLHVTVSSDGNQESVNKVIAYLNSNEIFLKNKEIVINETKLRISRNDTSIANIDGIFDEYANKTKQPIANPAQVYFRSQENNNLHQLIMTKNDLIIENEKLKQELVKYDNIVTVMSEPNLNSVYTTWSKKRLLLPFFLILFLCLFNFTKGLYKQGKKYAELEEARKG
jgi:hypothetical protein